MKELEKKIGYFFKDKELLETALSHSSFANESNGKWESYERLEFLGDSILGFTAAEYLYKHSPVLPEGQMTKLRAELVCEDSLYEIAKRLDFGKYMKLGKGAEKSGVRSIKSVMADMVESVIAAIFLDSDLEQAKAFIYSNLLNNVAVENLSVISDYKSLLQELVQKQKDFSIAYEEVSESGPDHNKSFTFDVIINGIKAGTGTGRTKKEAEQGAAKMALEVLKDEC